MTRTLLGLSEDVATAARPAMQLLLLWPAAIGLRRFLQGVLIRHGYTRHITWGTMFRLATLTVTMAVGVWFGGLPGAALGGLAMVLSVIIEAVVIAWWAQTDRAYPYLWQSGIPRSEPARHVLCRHVALLPALGCNRRHARHLPSTCRRRNSPLCNAGLILWPLSRSPLVWECSSPARCVPLTRW